MSSVFIPLGGAGGKNRGDKVFMDESYTHLKLGDTASMALPLPAGVYKKFKPERADDDLPESITSSGDGKNAVIVLEDKLLKKMALEAFGIASITNFSLSMYAHRQVRLTWAKPSQGLWSGVRFIFKYGSMPADENDGFMVYDSADVHYETPKLEERELYVRAYSYVTVKDGRWYDDGAVSAQIAVTGISGSVTLSTGAGVWTVPEGVRRIRYILVGHGGAGTQFTGNIGTGGGGGGGYFTTGYMDVTPGQQLPWIVPSEQGSATVLNGNKAESGKMSKLLYHPSSWKDGKPQYTASPYYESYASGGDGGSGGGGGYIKYANYYYGIGGCGGENGSNGKGAVSAIEETPALLALVVGGKGQGTSTQGFNGVLYCGGGGGMTTGRALDYGFSEKQHPSAPDIMEPTFEGGAYHYRKSGHGGDGGGGSSETVISRGLPINGTDGLGGGGGGSKEYPYKGTDAFGRRVGNVPRGPSVAGKGGTGCIYIAWGNLMND